MWPTAWLSSNHADVLTFSMILMLINIQVRALDLSGDSVFRHVERHDLTSHQHHGKSQRKNEHWKNELKWQKQKSIPRTRVVLGVKSPVPPSPVDGPRN